MNGLEWLLDGQEEQRMGKGAGSRSCGFAAAAGVHSASALKMTNYAFSFNIVSLCKIDHSNE